MAYKTLILLVGPSGSGKSTIAGELSKITGRKEVASYTTRPMRKGEVNGKGHIFLTDEEFDGIDPDEIAAYTLFNGYRYCTTNKVLEECGIYVIDKAGIESLKKRYTGAAKLFIAYVTANKSVLRKRMLERGDAPADVGKRLAHDKEAFDGTEKIADVLIRSDLYGPDVSAYIVLAEMLRKEKEAC